jgi:dolichol-phosphate mannosyltransferase
MPPDAAGATKTLDQQPLRAIELAARAVSGVRKPANWLQLLRFGIVGCAGYVINLGVFAVLVEELGLHHLLGAVGAFCVAVFNNYLWNRYWTFGPGDGHPGFEALRFFAVSTGALLINLAALQVLVAVIGLSALPAQALAVAFAMPFNFLGNKLWTFA